MPRCEGPSSATRSKTRNPKPEARINAETRMPNGVFFGFGHSSLIRISDFVIRVSPTRQLLHRVMHTPTLRPQCTYRFAVDNSPPLLSLRTVFFGFFFQPEYISPRRRTGNRTTKLEKALDYRADPKRVAVRSNQVRARRDRRPATRPPETNGPKSPKAGRVKVAASGERGHAGRNLPLCRLMRPSGIAPAVMPGQDRRGS